MIRAMIRAITWELAAAACTGAAACNGAAGTTGVASGSAAMRLR